MSTQPTDPSKLLTKRKSVDEGSNSFNAMNLDVANGNGVHNTVKRRKLDEVFGRGMNSGVARMFFRRRPNYDTHGLCNKPDAKGCRLFCLTVDLSKKIYVKLVKKMIFLCEGMHIGSFVIWYIDLFRIK